VDGVELYPGMCSGLETGVHIAGWSEAQTQFGERACLTLIVRLQVSRGVSFP